jgi:hypothetical protein
MGLLSNYADSQGGIGGLLGQPPSFGMDPNGQTAALIQSLLQSRGSLLPDQTAPSAGGFFAQPGYAGSPEASSPMPQLTAPQIDQPAPAPTMQNVPQQGAPHPGLLGGVEDFFGGLLGGQGSQQQGAPAPGGLLSPPQSQGQHGGLLGDIASGVGSAIRLPFDIVRGYAASAADIPDRIAFARQERAYQLNAARQNMSLVGSLIGGGGGLFPGGAPQDSPPSAGQAPAPSRSQGMPDSIPEGWGPGSSPGSYAQPDHFSSPVTINQSGPRRLSPVPESASDPSSDGTAGGAPPSGSPIGAPQLPGSGGSRFGGLDIRDPRTQRTLAALDLLGNPAGGQLATLGSSVLPKFSAARPGGMVLNESTGRFEGPSVPQDGSYNVPLLDGSFRNIPVQGAATNNAAFQGAAAGGRAAGEAIGKLPYVGPTAQAQAAGTGAGEAPYRMVTVPMPDGSTRTMSQAQYLALVGAVPGRNGVPRPPPSSPMADLGVSQSPASAAYAGDQATQLSKVVTADQEARQNAITSHDNAMRAIAAASSTAFNPLAPERYQAEKIGSILGIPSKDMDSLAAYQQLSTSAFLAYAKTNLPTRYTERELNLVKPAIGGIKDPNSAALMAAGLQAAIANKTLARAQYADSYEPAKGLTRQQYEAGWGNSPAGRASLFSDPVWQSIQIGGKPAVVRSTVRGHTALIVTPGLKLPTVIPVN